MIDQAATIQGLSDDALLLIFSFHRILSSPFNPPLSTEWEWHVLSQVCQRWRNLLFASPRHLGVRLVISNRKQYGRPTLESWPTLPISIWFSSQDTLFLRDEGRVIEALKHSDRIYEIKLNVSNWMIGKSTAFVNDSFPALEYLDLTSPCDVTVLPSTFLGGSISNPRKLRHIGLKNISLPTLPQLLLSSPNLVSLSLGFDHYGNPGSLSIDALTAVLSTMMQLERLYVYPYPDRDYPEQRRTFSPSSTENLIILRSLVTFDFGGPSGYLEDLIPRIDMPLLEQFSVSQTFGQRSYDIPQLSQFISRTKHLNSLPHRTSITFTNKALTIRHCFQHLLPRRTPIYLSFSIRGDWSEMDWRASQVVHICGQLSPFISNVERLGIRVERPLRFFDEDEPENEEMDTARWLELFGSFKSVQDLQLWCLLEGSTFGIADALEESTKETAQVLPILRILRIHGFQHHAENIPGIKAFIAARELTGQPLSVHEESKWGYEDEDTSETIDFTYA
jgi:hypothetical protein